MARDRRAGARRAEVLRLIRGEGDGIGVRALSEAAGMHENTVRFHLRRLVEEGLVERRPVAAGALGRPPLVYVATVGAGHDGAGNYALIAQVLSQGLAGHGGDAVAAAVEFGRQWGRARGRASGGQGRQEALAAVVQVLTETGFQPDVGQVEEGEAVVRVHNCPFRLLAEEDQAVPCGVHRGIMEGVLEASGAGPAVTELEPFVTPHLCLARVSFPA